MSWAGRHRKPLLGLAIALALAGTIAGNLLSGGSEEEDGAAGGGLTFSFGGKGKEVDLVRVRRGEIQRSVEASGLLEATQEVKISAEVVGRIQHLRVAEGDAVRLGQVLIEIEPSDFEARVSRARANQEIARASLQRAHAEAEEAARQLARKESLFGEGILSRQELDAAQTSVRIAETQIQSAIQSVAQGQADLDSALRDLEKTTIVSPIEGIVTRTHAEQGEVVVTGTMNNPGSVILELADLSGLLVTVAVEQSDVVGLRSGQPAEVEVDALPDRKFSGTVFEIASAGVREAEITTFPVKIRLIELDPDLRPGMTAHAVITVESLPDALLVPVGAVVERTRREITPAAERHRLHPRAADEVLEVVFELEDGRARARPVETGISDDYDVAVREGLEAGQAVISGPLRILRLLAEGDRVKPSADGRRVIEAPAAPPSPGPEPAATESEAPA